MIHIRGSGGQLLLPRDRGGGVPGSSSAATVTDDLRLVVIGHLV